MSALDRLSGFSAGKPVADGETKVFDTKTPSGAFLQQVHNAGYKMYEPCYRLKAEHLVVEETLSPEDLKAYRAAREISVAAYEQFNDEFKAMYEPGTRFTELHDVLTTDGNQIVNAVAGSGKALMNGTKVLTADGYRPIETLKVGDMVFGEDGEMHEVQGVFPQGLKTVYVVEFSDGNKIFCSGDHLWEVKPDGVDESGVCTTEQILRNVPLRDKDGSYCCEVPTTCAVKFAPKAVLPVHPYLLGFLLCSMSPDADGELWLDIRNWQYADEAMRRISDIVKLTYPDGATKMGSFIGVWRITAEKLVADLKEFGLFNTEAHERFIPVDYQFASISSRFELLRGMLDAIGMSDMRVMFTQSERFADDICNMFEGLGFVIEKRRTGNEFALTVLTEDFHALIPSVNADVSQYMTSINEKSVRYITHIEKLTRKEEMTCIAIDSPRHLYLTEHCIPTHNTTMLVFKILHDIVTGKCMMLKELENGMTVRVANKVWVCTFLRSGAAELEAALTKWQAKFGYSQTAPTLSFSTMDAEFKRCLNAMGVATPLDEGGKLYSCMVKAIDACNIKRNGFSLSKEDYNIIGGIITYYRGRLDDSKYKHPSCQEYELSPTILDLVVKQFANMRQQAGIMDFPEIMELLYKFLYVTPNPQVQEFVANRYNFIYIDEFQDTSQMAYAILKFYARGKLWMNRSGEVYTGPDAGLYTGHETLGKLVVVGDTAQCVLPGTKVYVSEGYTVPVERVMKGDQIQAIIGKNKLGYVTVDEVLTKQYSGDVCKISLSNGSNLGVTEDHKCFVKPQVGVDAPDIELCMFGGEHMQSKLSVTFPDGTSFAHQSYDVDALEELMKDAVIKFDNFGRIPTVQRTAILFMEQKYNIMRAGDVSFGDVMCVIDPIAGGLSQAVVMGTAIEHYEGPVYDFNIFDVHNFFADGVVVHNCIYSFRGSDSNILAKEVAEDFHPTVSTLSVNWRCPSNILDPVVPSIHKNWDSADQKIKAANQGGELYAYTFKNYSQMIAQLKTDVQKDMEDGLNVAILCRTNFDGLIPAVVMEQAGVFNFSVSGENMTMNSPLPRKLIGMTSLFTERATPAVKNSLMEFAGRANGWAVKQLIDVLKQNGKSIWDIPEDDIKYSCLSLLPFVKDIKPLLTVNGVRTKQAEVEALQVVYWKLMTDVYAGDSAYCESARAYLEVLLFILEQGNFKSVYEFLEEIEYLNDKLNGRIKKRKVYVQIATVHEFKGKEADSVYIWNDNDGVFPYSKCNLQVEGELNEERRVHYIACTRAKRREHIYSLAGKVGMFAREMDVKFTSPVPVSATLPKNGK